MSCHQPLRFVSCSLRVAAEIAGVNVMSEKIPLSRWLTGTSAKPPTTMNRTNHQYSEREASPWKSKYFAKQVWIDSWNVTP